MVISRERHGGDRFIEITYSTPYTERVMTIALLTIILRTLVIILRKGGRECWGGGVGEEEEILGFEKRAVYIHT